MSASLARRAERRLQRWAPDLRGGPTRAAGPLESERRLIRVVVPVTVLAVVAQSAVHLLNLLLLDLSLHVLNADKDVTLFSWASAAVTGAAAAFIALLAAVRPSRAPFLLGVAAATAFLSLDDTLQLHERISGLRTTLGPIEHFSRIFWPLVFLPLLAFVFVGLASLSAGMRPAAARLVRWGLGLLVVAIALEVSSPALFAFGWDHGDLAYELEVVLEEGAELGGWMLIASGLGACLLALGSDQEAPSAGPAQPRG